MNGRKATHELRIDISQNKYCRVLLATNEAGIVSGYEINAGDCAQNSDMCWDDYKTVGNSMISHHVKYQISQIREYLRRIQSPSFPARKKIAAKFNTQLDALEESADSLCFHDCPRITNTQEANMAKKKPEAAPAAIAATEDKLYLHVCSQSGYSMPMSVLLPLTEVGKKTISDAIDDGNKVEIIDKETFEQLRADSNGNLPAPTDQKHAEVCKMIDYEPLIKKIVACSEYFDHQFTADEIKQMAAEFSKSTARKTDLEDELKSHGQYLKSQITEVTATINRISQELGRGKRSESVKCHWVMNEPKRGLKSLYRLDTEPKEFVRMTGMSASDKQLTFEDLAAQKAKTERTLEEKPITPVANEPYEGEMLTDKEVEDETGANPQAAADADACAEAETEASDDSCPI